MEAYEIDNENDFKTQYFLFLEKNGIAGLKFDKLTTEYWLDNNKTSRIDICGKLNNINYYYELKDYRNLTRSQIYYKLGDLLLQIERYKSFIDLKKSHIKASILLPKHMPITMIEDIILLFRTRKIWIEVLSLNDLFNLNFKEIEEVYK